MSEHGAPFRATLDISMQRGTAIILTLLFGWLLVLPGFATSPELMAPRCCLKNGKHHCQMHGSEAGESGRAFAAMAERCPCCPHATFASQAQFSTPSTAAVIYAGLIRHPAASPQTDASYRISYDRSRQKRGPPPIQILL